MKLGLVGVGVIARKQHLPAIAATDGIALVATTSHAGTIDGVPAYPSLDAMLSAKPEIDGVVLCVPPNARYQYAAEAIGRGKHVFLEKPPGASLSEVGLLKQMALTAKVTLFASWHSRYAPAVEVFAAHLRRHVINKVEVVWKEDVRFYHPGQKWIWEAGGFGVFDPGINALSIMTHALPHPLRLTAAELFVPQNCAQPIKADLTLEDSAGVPVRCTFDWDQKGAATWDIIASTDGGTLRLSRGGAALEHNGDVLIDAPEEEYRRLYERFHSLVMSGESDVDLAPLTLVADAFWAAKTTFVAPFYEDEA